MKAWEQNYDDKVLKEAKNLVDNVKIISNDENHIIAEIDSFEIETYIEYNNPTHTLCNCPESFGCKHEAGFIYYLQNHPELYLKQPDFKELFDRVDKDNIKKFLLKEIEADENLKNKFINEFQNNSIDKDYYRNKLTEVFKTGEGRDFDNHHIHDLNLMEDALSSFMFHDITNILATGECDFAWELLCQIADLLNNDVVISSDSWLELSNQFIEYREILSNSINLDLDKMDLLYDKSNNIYDY